MTLAPLDWLPLSDWLGLAALILLAVPAVSAAAAADKHHRFFTVNLGKSVDPRLRDAKQRLDQKLSLLRNWSPWHSRCLYLGYTCALLSYLVKLC